MTVRLALAGLLLLAPAAVAIACGYCVEDRVAAAYDHSVGQGRKLGPDVAGVTQRRSDDWLARWLKSPEKMLQTDADAKAMLKEYNNLPMPNQSLSDAEIRQYLKYFHWIDSQPAGAAAANERH